MFLAARDAGERARVLGDGLGYGAIVNKLSPAAALDQTGIGKDFEVMRDGGGRDAAQGHQLAAHHLLFCGDGLENREARGIS